MTNKRARTNFLKNGCKKLQYLQRSKDVRARHKIVERVLERT